MCLTQKYSGDPLTLEQLVVLENSSHKELIVQAEHATLIKEVEELPGSFNILVREFKPETWEFGTLYELQIRRTITCSQLAEFMHKELFPHIPLATMFGSRVDITGTFHRSSLALKKWQSLVAQKVWVGSSNLKINGDSAFIVVRDQSKSMKQLEMGKDDDLIRKYAGPDYIEHLMRKAETKGEFLGAKDTLFEASQANSYTFTGSNKPEKAIKINPELAFTQPEGKEAKVDD